MTTAEPFDFGGHVGCPRFRRNPFDCEVGEMIRLLSVLEEFKPDSSTLRSGLLIVKAFLHPNLYILS